MGVLLIFLGLGWFLYQVAKESTIKQVPTDMNYKQIMSDRANGVSNKEIDRRMYSGYYNEKK